MIHDKHQVSYGNQRLSFTIRRSRRRTLAIQVYPSKMVEVVAPQDADLKTICEKITKRARWITKQQIYFERFEPMPAQKQFVGGETHYYMGRQYRLKLHIDHSGAVKLMGKYLHVSVSQLDIRNVQMVLNAWYVKQAKRTISKKIEEFLEQWPLLFVNPQKISIRSMQKRWGSCTGDGHIQFNTDLIKTPTQCIEYVIAHEMCHLNINKHNRAFYLLLTQVMPDWEKRKIQLDQFVFNR